MVRKTTRSLLKASEKSKPESPKRGSKTTNRNIRSSSNSADEDDISQKVNKNLSPSHADKGSSDNESDTESKKPLKKRTRSMAVKEETPQSVSRTKSSRWDKQPKSPPNKIEQQDKDEEVKEEENSKGKSKNKNISSNDNVVTPKIENENVQVTDESPSDVKDDNHDTLVKNGQTKKETETDVNIIKTIDSANVPDRQSSEVTPEQPKELSHQSNKISEKPSKSPSKEKTEKRESSENQSESKDKEKKLVEKKSSEQSKDLIEEKPKKENDGKNENSKKIRLKRPSNDKRTPESEDKKEDGSRKRITLKRPESKPIMEESKAQVENDEPSQNEEWSSSYEANNEKTKKDEPELHEEQSTRKRITLKRSTAEEKKPAENNLQDSSDNKKEISLGRSVSLVEHKKEESDTSNGIRRRSSASGRSVSETEVKPDPPKKPTKVVKLIRVISKEPQEPLPPGEVTVKKFKWGQSDMSYTSEHTLNFESLKEACPAIEFLNEDEVNLEIIVKENKITTKERRKTFTELEEEEMENIEAELNAEPEEIEKKENIIAMNRKISIVDDTASKMRPPPSPARNPLSEVLFITNLVRPFTVKQLKELLERTGKIREDGFWTDRIKSKCYVYYEKAEEAEATRNALHGVNWPIGNGKKLIIDYATVEDLENAKTPPVPVKREKTPEKENKKPFVPDEKEDKHRSRSDKREWDLGKEEDHHRRRSRSRSKERQRKHSRRSYTPEDYHSKKRKHEDTVPQKAMDDLFSKTKATPSIYWQPLSPEEIALKQQQRQARLEENKRRLEEISRTSNRGTRDRGRDRNFRRR